MQPQRMKPPTRGALHIMRENAEINRLLHNVAFGLTIVRLIISGLFTLVGFKPNLLTQSWLDIVLNHFSMPIVLTCISRLIKKISTPLYSDTPDRRLISPGYDLNMHGGWGEYLKELSLTLTFIHLLSAFASIFWYLLLLVPIGSMYKFWKYILRPYLILIFTDIPDTPEEIERNKKIMKKTAKKKRFKYLRSITHWHHFR